jgi:hypothetical protein
MPRTLPYAIWENENGQQVRLLYTKPDERGLYRPHVVDKGYEDEIRIGDFSKPFFELRGDPDFDTAQMQLNEYASGKGWKFIEKIP